MTGSALRAGLEIVIIIDKIKRDESIQKGFLVTGHRLINNKLPVKDLLIINFL